MKKLIILAVLLLPIKAFALPQIDIAKIFGETRASLLYTTQGKDYAGICVPVISYMPKENLELMNINVGYANDNSNGTGYPLLALGLRIDSVFKLVSDWSWAKKYLLLAKLPALEIGTFGTLINDRGVYGLSISYKMGGSK